MIATIVQWKELWQTVVASVVAGVGVTFCFSVAIWGVGRFAEMSRDDRPLAAMGGAIATGVALCAVAVAVVIGIVVMTHK